MVTPTMSVAHVRTLLADVDVIQGPLILLAIVVLDPAEPRGTGPEHRRYTHTNSLTRFTPQKLDKMYMDGKKNCNTVTDCSIITDKKN